jgi:carboxyl-terminal processing protease
MCLKFSPVRYRWFMLVAIGTIVIGPVLPAAGQSSSLSEVAHEAWSLAREGRLSEAIGRIKSAARTEASDSDLVELNRQVELHESMQAQREQRMADAFDRTMQKLAEHLREGDLTKALSSAVEAHGLAEDQTKFLDRTDLRSLVALAEKRAEQYQRDHQWLEALALYRRLGLLYEEQDRFTDQVKRVSRRMRMIRNYAPDHWFKMAVDYAKEHGEDEPKRWAGDEDDHWRKQLQDITLSQLRQALDQSVRDHVESATFEQLLAGGISAVRDLLSTRALTESFPTLTNVQAVERFDAYLARLAQRVERRDVDMSYLEAASLLRELLDENQQTVRLPEEVIISELADGAMSTLDDFSAVIWPADKARLERTTKQQFTGVGIQITLADDQLTVVSPLEDSPAQRAGVKAGDRIVSIDGRPTAGISLNQAVETITGRKGTTVRLGIKSAGSGRERVVRLKRDVIRIHSVKGWGRSPGGQWNYYIDADSRIGYIRITQFGPDTADEMDKAVEQMQRRRGLNGLIIDLRFNPGGTLPAAIDVSNRFIDSGMIVSSHVSDDNGFDAGTFGRRARAWQARADRHHTYDPIPLVVLVNRGSASASEIVAGCLQDHGRALIVGERSYGKGSVQQVFGLSFNSAALKLTTQYYQLPNGRIIHRRPGASEWGIEPDVEVRMTDHEVEQLIKARMVVDALRTDGEVDFDPHAILGTVDEDEEDATFDDGPPVTTVDEILTRGLDPQLETALLLLRARLLDEPVIASR